MNFPVLAIPLHLASPEFHSEIRTLLQIFLSSSQLRLFFLLE